MYIFENVWLKETESKKDVIDLWINENVFPKEIAEQRAKQLVFIVREESSNEVIGVSTSYIKQIPTINNNYFYYYRTYVSNNYRGHKLARLIMINTRELFNKLFLEGKETKAIGIFLEVENEALKKRIKAHWEYPNFIFTFIGTIPNGSHIRITYFDNALI
ncbi:MAG: hypothetical protein H7263_10705 [Candidatus Sericytochromatia bacterium]|nr:hypothetical protein [Candidatus Sericytochromatia bacterium]